MKEFGKKERKLAILGLLLTGVLIVLYEFLVPTALMIRVFKAVLPAVLALLTVFFVVSVHMYSKDKQALAASKGIKPSALDFPLSLKNGVYRDMSTGIMVLDVLSVIFILLTIGGYYYQYKNTDLYKYYPLIVTVMIFVLEVGILIMYTMEGKVKDNSEYYNKLVEAQIEKDKQAEANAIEMTEVISDAESVSEESLEAHEEKSEGAEEGSKGIQFGSVS